MRVLIFTSSTNTSGGTRQALYLAQGLRAAGHDADFFIPHDSPLAEVAPDFPFQRLPRERRAWRAALEKHFSDSSPTMVHAFHNRCVKLLSWWGLLWRRKGVVCVANRGVCHRPGNLLPYWSPGIDCFTVNSKACSDVLARVGVGATRRELIYNGIPAERAMPRRPAEDVRAEWDLDASRPIIGTVGNDAPSKGFEPFLRAVAQVENITAVIVGAKPELWTRLVNEMGVGERVRIVPYTNHVADLLQVMDVFVLPYQGLQDSLPNTLLEAMLAGLPVVATRVGGVPEIAPNILEDSGLLVEPGTSPKHVAGLAKAIQRLVYDTDLRVRVATACAETGQRFTLEAKVDKTLALYQRLLQRQGLASSSAPLQTEKSA
jgi:glycosyltransferase involved in cell wall biosynthesis